MTVRNRVHCKITSNVAFELVGWLRSQPTPKGEVLSGESGCILSRDPYTVFGIDVAYYSAKTLAEQTEVTTMVEGAPRLAVEILSPSNRQEEIDNKVNELLEYGVGIVWIIHARCKHVTVYRPDHDPYFAAGDQILTAEPELPGFSVRVSDLFK